MKPAYNYKHGVTAAQDKRGLNVARRREPIEVDMFCVGNDEPSDFELAQQDDCFDGLFDCKSCREPTW